MYPFVNSLVTSIGSLAASSCLVFELHRQKSAVISVTVNFDLHSQARLRTCEWKNSVIQVAATHFGARHATRLMALVARKVGRELQVKR